MLWDAIPNKELILSVLSYCMFVASLCAALSYQIRDKYNQLLEHPTLSIREHQRLALTISIRIQRVTLFTIFGVIVAVCLATSKIFNYFPNFSDIYFRVVSTGLIIQIVLFILVLLSFREIEQFKTKLESRKRQRDEQKRLLDELS